MIDHNKIEDAVNSYFKNTPTAKIIENLDRHRENFKYRLVRDIIEQPIEYRKLQGVDLSGTNLNDANL